MMVANYSRRIKQNEDQRELLHVRTGKHRRKIYKEFVQRHYKGAAANGSEQDHKALGDVPNKYILQGFDGFGGHRERAMDCLAGNEDFIKFVEGIKEDIVFILFAGGGSTGSGCAPIVAEMLLEEKDEEGNPVKTVCPVIALPASGESLAKHKNAYETVQELQEIEGLGATFFLNNDSNENYDYTIRILQVCWMNFFQMRVTADRTILMNQSVWKC